MNQHERELSELLKRSEKTPEAIGQAFALIIRSAQDVLERTGITALDIATFMTEISQVNAVGPMLDPTDWMLRGGMSRQVAEANRRSEIVSTVLKLTDVPVCGLSLLDDVMMTAAFATDGVVQAYIVAPVESEASK